MKAESVDNITPVENDLYRVALEASVATGDNYFGSLAQSLSRLLDAEYIIVGEYLHQTETIRTVSATLNSQSVPEFSYSLEGTPCHNVISNDVCIHPTGIQCSFPDDEILVEWEAESYLGMPLRSSAGVTIGLIAIIGKRPLDSPGYAESVLRIFGSRAAAELERHQQERLLRTLHKAVEHSPGSVIVTDTTGKIEYVNPGFTLLTGFQPQDVLGKTPYVLKSGNMDPSVYEALWSALREGETWRGELENRKRNGDIFWESATISPVFDNDGGMTHYLKIAEDITDRKQAEDQIQQMTYFDRLTGLANSFRFNEELCRKIEESDSSSRFAIVLIDIDDFSKFNHTFGHVAGNSILMETAARLEDSVSPCDTVARYSADTFAVLVANTDEKSDVEGAVQKLQLMFEQPFPLLSQGEYALSSCVGVSIFPADGKDPETLFQHADTALTQAKRNGRNSVRHYIPSMNAANKMLLNLENDLRKAIERDELRVFFQPQVDAGKGVLTGFEALLRWEHATLGMVSPGDFIPLAEESGLITELGAWVLTQACRQAQELLQTGVSFQKIAVNVSARQFFGQGLLTEVNSALQSSGLPPGMLELEITESAVMNDPENTRKVLDEIRALGVQIALDDFGTGHSSLSYLKKFPINKLKIDRSFVQGIESSDDDAAIIQTIIAMTETLNLNVIAEGVETEAQKELLISWGCHNFQGFHFGRPMPQDELQSWYKQQQSELNQGQDMSRSSDDRKQRKSNFIAHDVDYFRNGLSDKEFARLGQLIYEQAGIQMKPQKKSMLEARLRKRLRTLEFKSFNEYLDYLFSGKGMKDELINMVDVVTTNKTDFFREPAHFDFLTNTALPQLALERGLGFEGRPLRVWSAGCSSGEEPYTIAMVLNEFAEQNPGFEYSIVGTDISTIVLDKCRQAIYKEEKVEPVPLELKKKYLLRSRNRDEKTVRICEDLRNKISFERLNFMDEEFSFEQPFDLIFCRNVIIYFDRPTQMQLLNKFMPHLHEGGFLLMGHSETLHGMGLPLHQLHPATYQRA